MNISFIKKVFLFNKNRGNLFSALFSRLYAKPLLIQMFLEVQSF